jgi:hypothetical protein
VFIIRQGIHVVHSSCPEVTHHVLQELTLTPSCLLSLLNSQVVTPKWFAEVIHKGTKGNRSSILEQDFELPDASSYLPAVSNALPLTLSSMDFWTNGPGRRRILDEYRFVIFTRNSDSVEDLQSVISLSGGGYERFQVDSGKIRLHRRLSADKDKRRKVVVVDDGVKASVALDLWNELVDEAETSVLSHTLLFPSLNILKVRVDILQSGAGSRNHCRWRFLSSGPSSRFVQIFGWYFFIDSLNACYSVTSGRSPFQFR